MAASDEEEIVYGVSRPSYNAEMVNLEAVDEWIAFMKRNGIQRVCCLLNDFQLCYYSDESLIECCQRDLGAENVINPGLVDPRPRHGV